MQATDVTYRVPPVGGRWLGQGGGQGGGWLAVWPRSAWETPSRRGPPGDKSPGYGLRRVKPASKPRQGGPFSQSWIHPAQLIARRFISGRSHVRQCGESFRPRTRSRSLPSHSQTYILAFLREEIEMKSATK